MHACANLTTCADVRPQEEQLEFRGGHHSSAGVAPVPAAALRVLPAAALPANNTHQDANRGERKQTVHL